MSFFTWIYCDQHSCHSFCPCPNRGLALCLWSCDLGLCLFPVPSLFPSRVPAPSPSRVPVALFPALALFPFPSVPAQTPASLSPSCPFLLQVSAEQNRNWFSQWHTRCGESTLTLSPAQIKWFPDLKRCFIQEHAPISAQLVREAGVLTRNPGKMNGSPSERHMISH